MCYIIYEWSLTSKRSPFSQRPSMQPPFGHLLGENKKQVKSFFIFWVSAFVVKSRLWSHQLASCVQRRKSFQYEKKKHKQLYCFKQVTFKAQIPWYLSIRNLKKDYHLSSLAGFDFLINAVFCMVEHKTAPFSVFKAKFS